MMGTFSSLASSFRPRESRDFRVPVVEPPVARPSTACSPRSGGPAPSRASGAATWRASPERSEACAVVDVKLAPEIRGLGRDQRTCLLPSRRSRRGPSWASTSASEQRTRKPICSLDISREKSRSTFPGRKATCWSDVEGERGSSPPIGRGPHDDQVRELKARGHAIQLSESPSPGPESMPCRPVGLLDDVQVVLGRWARSLSNPPRTASFGDVEDLAGAASRKQGSRRPRSPVTVRRARSSGPARISSPQRRLFLHDPGVVLDVADVSECRPAGPSGTTIPPPSRRLRCGPAPL